MGSTTKFTHQKPMPGPQPLARPHPRASEAQIRSQTGGSGPANAPGHHHVHYSKIGDHRQANLHSGSQNSSAVPRIDAGRAKQIPSNGGSYGDDAA